MRALFLSFLIPLAAGNAFGWGCEGHQIIALIARAQLTPKTSAEVDKLLKENPISPALSRFCKERQSDPMADSATWADDQRSIEKATAAWHFVDIPLAMLTPPAKDYSIDQWCPEKSDEGSGCVTKAIESQWAILKDKTKSGAERARALRFLIHFVEDTHQPLHDTDNNDQGGNCTTVKFLNEDRPTNLHAIWDYKLIQHDMTTRKLDQAAYAASLTTEFAKRRKSWGKEKINPELWAWQGHDLGVKLTYGLVSPAIPVEKPGPTNCPDERTKIAALNIALGDSYFQGSIPAVREQLAHSAARLANVLNKSF
jgi:hypothetical protein